MLRWCSVASISLPFLTRADGGALDRLGKSLDPACIREAVAVGAAPDDDEGSFGQSCESGCLDMAPLPPWEHPLILLSLYELVARGQPRCELAEATVEQIAMREWVCGHSAAGGQQRQGQEQLRTRAEQPDQSASLVRQPQQSRGELGVVAQHAIGREGTTGDDEDVDGQRTAERIEADVALREPCRTAGWLREEEDLRAGLDRWVSREHGEQRERMVAAVVGSCGHCDRTGLPTAWEEGSAVMTPLAATLITHLALLPLGHPRRAHEHDVSASPLEPSP